MKRLLWISLLVFTLGACCKAICEDQQLLVSGQGFQYTDVDTLFLVKYKRGSNFAERIDTIKRYMAAPVNNTQSVSFFETLNAATDWKVVIPALNKEYFISNIETEKGRCECEPGNYRTVQRFQFNNTEVEGSSVSLN